MSRMCELCGEIMLAYFLLYLELKFVMAMIDVSIIRVFNWEMFFEIKLGKKRECGISELNIMLFSSYGHKIWRRAGLRSNIGILTFNHLIRREMSAVVSGVVVCQLIRLKNR